MNMFYRNLCILAILPPQKHLQELRDYMHISARNLQELESCFHQRIWYMNSRTLDTIHPTNTRTVSIFYSILETGFTASWAGFSQVLVSETYGPGTVSREEAVMSIAALLYD